MVFDAHTAPITLLLLIVNGLVSGYALLSEPSLVERLGLSPRRILEQNEYYRFITAGFVHVGFGHLAVNMITLYFFGPVLEPVLGAVGFLVLYFGAELAAHGLAFWHQRDNTQYMAVGASGAISGVVFAYCLFAPFEMIYVFFALPMPTWLFAVVYVVGSIYAMRQAKAEGRVGGIAHEAHLGGALGGVLLTLALEPWVVGRLMEQLGLG